MMRIASPLAFACALLAAPHARAQCDDISAIPARYAIDFETEVQPYIGGVTGSPITPYCNNCHVQSSAGGMNMAPANIRSSWLGPDETGRDSLNFPEWRRIVPGRPDLSLVYQRMHCDDSPPGRMPPSHPGGALDPTFLQFQALLHDWIALGAIFDDGDRMFVGDFETIR